MFDAINILGVVIRIMITLDLKPLKKKLHVVIVRKPYDEPWSLESSIDDFKGTDSDFIKPSLHCSESLKKVVGREWPDLVTEERGDIPESKAMDVKKLIMDVLAREIPYRLVDIDEYARIYLAQRLELKSTRCAEIEGTLRILSKIEHSNEDRARVDRLSAYFLDQKRQLEDEEYLIEHAIRERWIAKGILDAANQLEKWKLKILHLSSPRYEEGLTNLLEKLDVKVTHFGLDQAASEARRVQIVSAQH